MQCEDRTEANSFLAELRRLSGAPDSLACVRFYRSVSILEDSTSIVLPLLVAVIPARALPLLPEVCQCWAIALSDLR